MSRFAAYGYDQRCEIFGTKGAVRVESIKEHAAVVATSAGMRQARLQHSFPERFHQAFGLELDAFADTILSGAEWPITASQCVNVQRVADAARLSSRTGLTVLIPEVSS